VVQVLVGAIIRTGNFAVSGLVVPRPASEKYTTDSGEPPRANQPSNRVAPRRF